VKHLVVWVALLGQTTPAAVALKFDSSRAWEHLRQIVAIGPRPAGSPALERTRTYIKDQMKGIGLPVTEQVWEAKTPNGPARMVNLIVTIPGDRKDTRNRIMFSGHYDTKLFREFRFVGANDGGSSAAFLIELARVLKARRNPLTIDLVFLDGEEAVCANWTDCGTPGAPDNTYGSRHYVETAKRDGTLATLKANVLVDMVAERDLRILRDTNSTPWLIDVIWAAARRLKHDRTFAAESMPVEDDHLPFIAAGVPSVDLIDLDYAAWHTAGDTLDAVSARSLQIVGDVVLAALPAIESRVQK
jgi:Zn-dependent M28 family amino/carboxypeptidase